MTADPLVLILVKPLESWDGVKNLDCAEPLSLRFDGQLPRFNLEKELFQSFGQRKEIRGCAGSFLLRIGHLSGMQRLLIFLKSHENLLIFLGLGCSNWLFWSSRSEEIHVFTHISFLEGCNSRVDWVHGTKAGIAHILRLLSRWSRCNNFGSHCTFVGPNGTHHEPGRLLGMLDPAFRRWWACNRSLSKPSRTGCAQS